MIYYYYLREYYLIMRDEVEHPTSFVEVKELSKNMSDRSEV